MSEAFQCDRTTCQKFFTYEPNEIGFRQHDADDEVAEVIYDVCDECFASLQQPFQQEAGKAQETAPDQQPEPAQEPASPTSPEDGQQPTPPSSDTVPQN